MDFSRVKTSLPNICCLIIMGSLMLPWLDGELGSVALEASGLEFLTGKTFNGFTFTKGFDDYLQMWPVLCAVIALFALLQNLNRSDDNKLYMVAGALAALSPIMLKTGIDLPRGAGDALSDFAGIGVWVNCLAGGLILAIASGKMKDPMMRKVEPSESNDG